MRGERVHERERSPVLGYRLEHLGKRYRGNIWMFWPSWSSCQGRPILGVSPGLGGLGCRLAP